MMVIILKRLVIISILIFFLTISIKSFAFCNYIIEMKDKILKEYILYEYIEEFNIISDLVKSHMEESLELVKTPPSSNYELNKLWFKKLKNENILKAVYYKFKDKSYIIGFDFKPDHNFKNSYFINKNGLLHYVYVNRGKALFVDIIPDLSSLTKLMMNINRIHSIILYDNNTKNFIKVYDKNGNLTVNKKVINNDLVNKNVFIGKNRILFSKDLKLQNSQILLISILKVQIFSRVLWLFGLLVIIILTILLVTYTIKYISKVEVYEMMEEKGEEDIISEIDKEISVIIEEPEKESHNESEKENILQALKKNGIYIKKIT